MTPVLKEAQEITLAGMRVTDARGVIVASTGTDAGLSLLGQDEVRDALQGQPGSVMRRREKPATWVPEGITRGASLRVVVALPVLDGGRVLGAVVVSRTPADIVFRDELRAIEADHPGVRVVVVCETDAADEPWTGPRGRVSLAQLLDAAPDLAGREVFTCGPAPYMAAVRDLLDELNVEMNPDFVYSFLDGQLKDSLNAGLNSLLNNGAKPDDRLPETLFFFPFRDALFQLGRELFRRYYAAQPK